MLELCESSRPDSGSGSLRRLLPKGRSAPLDVVLLTMEVGGKDVNDISSPSPLALSELLFAAPLWRYES